MNTTTPRRLAALAAAVSLLFAGGVSAAASVGRKAAVAAAVSPVSPASSSSSSSEAAADAAPVAAPFTDALAFATKTGFRGVVTWSASSPVAAVVKWGLSPDNLDQTLVVPDGPDTAGIAVIDKLAIGTTYYVAVQDAVSGAVAGPMQLVAANAYNNYDPATDTYDLNLLVQLDSQSLPEGVPSDQALAEIGQGVSVFAERMYDALDGHARLNHVVVADTQIAYAVNEPFGVEETVVATGDVNPCAADRNLADVLVQTSVPFDSHTFLWAIDEPCTSFYVGREGQLVVPWTGDLHFGYVSTHEMMHYAFGAPDLYDPAAVTESGCKNADWDGSLMHNTGGWAGNQWLLTELDRSPEQTPCDHQHDETWTWDSLQTRYTQIPDGPIEHMIDVLPRGNEDGGVLDIRLLDRGPATSSLTAFTPSDENPEYNPGTCAADQSSTTFPDPVGDATVVLGVDHGVKAYGDPAIDAVEGAVAYEDVDGDGQTSPADRLRFTLTMDDLKETPAAGSQGEYFEFGFLIGSSGYYVAAEWDRVPRVSATSEEHVAEGPTFELGRFEVTRSLIADVDGTWNVDTDEVSIVVPAFIPGLGGGPALFQLPAGARISGLHATTRRVVGRVIPDADVAGGGCAIVTPAVASAFPTPPPPPTVPTSPDASLAGGERVTLAGRTWASNSGYSACVDNLDDPRCNVFMVEVGASGVLEFDVASNAEPLEDYDVYLYDIDRAQLFFAGLTGPADASAWPVDPGRYYVQVVPYDAPAGALFSLNLALVGA